jgi:hypothetical protein
LMAPPRTAAASKHRGCEAAGGSSPGLAPAGRRPAHSPRMAASPRQAGPEREGLGYRQFVHHGMRPWLRQDVYDYCGEESTSGDDGEADSATSTVPEEHQKSNRSRKRGRTCVLFRYSTYTMYKYSATPSHRVASLPDIVLLTGPPDRPTGSRRAGRTGAYSRAGCFLRAYRYRRYRRR